jgi:hypothetical protein
VSTLRVYKANLTALPLAKLRVYKTSLDATSPIVSALRVYKTSLDAIAAVLVSLQPSLTAGPGEVVTLTAELLTGGSPTWQWRRISGPTVGLPATGATASLTMPSLWNPDTATPTSGAPAPSLLLVGVRATVGGVQSPEVTCQISILPQLSWSRSGSTWVGARVAPASA